MEESGKMNSTELQDLLERIGHHSLNIITETKRAGETKNFYWEQAVLINKLSHKAHQILKKQD